MCRRRSRMLTECCIAGCHCARLSLRGSSTACMLTAREANFVFVQTRRKREDRGVGKRGLGSLLRPVVPVCASTRRARSHSLVRLGWRRLCQCLFLPSPTVDFELATCELVRLSLWSLRILRVDAHWLVRWPRVTPSVKVWTRPLVILSRISQQSVVEGMDPTAYRVPRRQRLRAVQGHWFCLGHARLWR